VSIFVSSFFGWKVLCQVHVVDSQVPPFHLAAIKVFFFIQQTQERNCLPFVKNVFVVRAGDFLSTIHF